MYPKYACKQHIEAIKDLEKAGIYSSDFIPQLEDVSTFLKRKKTNWVILHFYSLIFLGGFLLQKGLDFSWGP